MVFFLLCRAIGITGCGKRVRTSNDTCPGCASFRQNNTITNFQERKCQDDPGAFQGLSAGARQAIISCQQQFNSSLWNCSTLYGEHLFGAFVARSEFNIQPASLSKCMTMNSTCLPHVSTACSFLYSSRP